jgi:hypothetical protein
MKSVSELFVDTEANATYYKYRVGDLIEIRDIAK